MTGFVCLANFSDWWMKYYDLETGCWVLELHYITLHYMALPFANWHLFVKHQCWTQPYPPMGFRKKLPLFEPDRFSCNIAGNDNAFILLPRSVPCGLQSGLGLIVFGGSTLEGAPHWKTRNFFLDMWILFTWCFLNRNAVWNDWKHFETLSWYTIIYVHCAMNILGIQSSRIFVYINRYVKICIVYCKYHENSVT